MTTADTRRDLSKMRTVPLDDATHRRLRLYVHGLREDGDASVALARVAAEAVNAYIDRQEGGEPVAVCVVGDPSEGEGELYGQWRKP